jgi:HEAT repeat protein
MSLLLPPLPPTFEAAVRDVSARKVEARVAAAKRLGGTSEPEPRATALASLRTLLSDRDARVRAAAVEALHELADPTCLDALVGRLGDADPLVRELAVIALGALPDGVAIDALRQATTSEHAEVRFQAVLSYAEAGPAPLSAVVLSRLHDDDPRVRAHAARAARLLGMSDAAAPLRAALSDPAARVRAEAALSLHDGGEDADPEALAVALDEPDLTLEALDAIGAARLSALREPVAVLASRVLGPRWRKAAAARALVRLGDELGVAALREVLTSLRGDGRSLAAQAAGELGLTELVPDLVRLCRRPRGADPVVLAEALAALLPRAETAREGLSLLARRPDQAGELARAALA